MWFILDKKLVCERPHFRANNVLKSVFKFLFWKRRRRYKNGICQFVALISMEHFRMFKGAKKL